jgi:hypothetical protein
MVQYMRQLEETVSQNYDVISWLFRILLGGAINIVLLSVLVSFVEFYVPLVNGSYDTSVLFAPQLLPTFLFLSIAYFISPLILSICLTKRQPYLKIVPPFYISIISIVWMLTYWLSSNISLLPIVVAFGLTVGYAGYYEDTLATSLMGIATTGDMIYFEHLRLYADIETVKARICVPAIMNALHLSERIEGDNEQGYRFISKRDQFFKTLISLSKDKDYPNLTDVKVAYFEKTRYSIRSSPDLLEYVRKTSKYLQLSVFLEREPKLICEVVMAPTNTARDPLIDSIEDELQGYYARYKRLPARNSIKILGLLGLALLTIGLVLSGQPDIYWQLSILFDVFVYLSELPDLIRRR